MSLHTPHVLRVPIWTRYEWDASASRSSYVRAAQARHGCAPSPCLKRGTVAEPAACIAHVNAVVLSLVWAVRSAQWVLPCMPMSWIMSYALVVSVAPAPGVRSRRIRMWTQAAAQCRPRKGPSRGGPFIWPTLVPLHDDTPSSPSQALRVFREKAARSLE